MRTPVAVLICLVVLLAVAPLYADQLVNPGFEDGTNGWTVTGGTVETHYSGLGDVGPTEGEHFLWLHQPANLLEVSSAKQTVNLRPGETIFGMYRCLAGDGATGQEAVMQIYVRLGWVAYGIVEWYPQDGSTAWLLWRYTATQPGEYEVVYSLTNLDLYGDDQVAAFFDTYVPEPTSVATGLSVLAMLGLTVYRRRRRT